MYNFTYSSDLPDNLCPYFWKLVLAVIVFIPNFILQLPVLICSLFTKNVVDNPKEQRISGTLIYVCLLFLWGYILSTIHMVKAIFNCYSYNSKVVEIGFILNGVIIFICLVILVMNLREKIQDRKSISENEPSSNIIIEFAKAKYYKYCPKIDWE